MIRHRPWSPPGADRRRASHVAAPDLNQASRLLDVSCRCRSPGHVAAKPRATRRKGGRYAPDNPRSGGTGLAARNVKQHHKAAKKLKSLAQKAGVHLPKQLPEEKHALRAGLADLSGGTFDTEFTWNMLALHTVSRNLLETQVEEGSHPMVVKFAEQALKTQKQHRQKALQLWEEVG